MIIKYGIKDLNVIHTFVKMLTAEMIQAALNAELENDLRYSDCNSVRVVNPILD